MLLSAALTTLLPADFFAGLAGYSMLAAFAVVLAASVPLYVCATASVPVAASLVAAGMPTGAAMVFLMAGPATNAATLGAVYRTFGSRTVAVYLVTIVVGSGPSGWDTKPCSGPSPSPQPMPTHTIPWWGAASGGLFTAMLAWFAIDDLREWFARRAMAQRAAQVVQDAPPIVIGVGGMTCGGCRGKLGRCYVKKPA